MSARKGLLAFSPAFVLLAFYLSASLVAGDFYSVPISVAFVFASVYGLLIMRGRSFEERISIFSQGAADQKLLYMVWIFVLAGIFASSAKATGAVDATVRLTLSFVPGRFLPAGIFIASCFISMAIGTSVGTVVALTPVAAGMASSLCVNPAWMTAIVVGGAFFGDNLSFISDTTIASTQTQGCSMKDKFKTNFLIVLPAALVTLAIYIFQPAPSTGDVFSAINGGPDVPLWLSIPYFLVIALSLAGVKVLVVLVLGIVATWTVGLIDGAETLALLKASGSGIQSMCELILITLMACGLMNIIKHLDGFEFLITRLTSNIRGRRGAEAAIASITAITNLVTANNTIAILTAGSIARDISTKHNVSPGRAASILDTVSCVIQGIIPYGAQLLMAAGMAGISSVEIVGYLYYPMVLAVVLIASILTGFPRRPNTVPSGK